MAKVDFGFRTSCVGTTAKVHVFSFSNTTPTITVEGETPATPSMVNTALNDGAGGIYPNGDSFDSAKDYYGTATFSGLPENSVLTVTVNQDGNIRTGKVSTDPTGNFSLFGISCYKYQGSGKQHNVGCMGYIADYIDNGQYPTHGVLHVDDHGYIDRVILDNELMDAPHIWTPTLTRLEDMSTAYAKSLGFMQYEGIVNGETVGDWWYEPLGQYVKTNANSYNVIGDHELTNNSETVGTLTTADIAAARKAFAATIGGAQTYIGDPLTTGDLSSVFRIGPIEFIAYDRISRLAQLTKVWDLDTQAVVSGDWLTSPQITGLLGEIDSSSPFKCLLGSAGIRFATKQAERLAGIAQGYPEPAVGDAQQPIQNYTNTSADGDGADSELRTLLTAKTTSIGAIAQAYGGKLFGIHGDSHRQGERRYYFPQDANNVEVEFLECSTGSVNGSDMHLLHPKFQTGTAWGGNEVTWNHPDVVFSSDNADKISRYTCIRLDVIQEGVTDPYIDVVYLEVEDPDNNPTVATELRRTRITTGRQAGEFRKGFL